MSRSRTFALVAVLTVLPACGGAAGGAATSSAEGRSEASRAKLAVDAGAVGDMLRADQPRVRRTKGGFVAIMGSSTEDGSPRVRLGSIGYPGSGSADGKRYVGPALSMPWTQINHGTYTATIRTDSRHVGLRIWSRGGQWSARVDGQLVRGGPRSVGSGSTFHTLYVNFPQRRTRTVTFELRAGAWVAGIRADQGSRVLAPPPVRGPSVYWLGDSYFAGGGSRHPGFSDLVHVASRGLRIQDAPVDAFGGTGYVKSNPVGDFPNFYVRARKNLGPGRALPDVIVVGGSINDATEPSPEVGSRATALFRYLRRAVPDAKLFAIPFTSGYPEAPGTRARNAAVAAAARSTGVQLLDLPRVVAARAQGTSHLQGADSHPTQLGHEVYGRLIARYLRDRIR